MVSDQHLDQLRQLARQPSPTAKLPTHLHKLHHKAMKQIQAERESRRQKQDDEGRSWGPAGHTTTGGD
jgi:hypothetical protein